MYESDRTHRAYFFLKQKPQVMYLLSCIPHCRTNDNWIRKNNVYKKQFLNFYPVFFLSLCPWDLPHRFNHEESDNTKRDDGRDPEGNMNAETVHHHDNAEEADGVHCPVFKIPVFLDIVNIT